ncbi:TIM-barrel domain-containing protein [Mariniflexile aquimaris]|uniref:TIM-barrel domain-containing protein n=1 Tax=Mariniflexile aquimaris TaxID=881009 RepID=A0ABW3BML5_9FLAO
MKQLYRLVLILFVVQTTYGQNANRIFENMIENDRGIILKVNDGNYHIQFYTPEIVETTFIPNGQVINPESHAVVLKPKKIETTLVAGASEMLYASSGISVHIKNQPFQIAYSYKGKPIISEKAGYVKNDSLETLQFNLKKDEVLYGGGARALGMDRRGNRLKLYNRAHYGYETRSELMNFTMPIVLSSNEYLIHFDNAPIGFLDLDSKQDNTLTYETISGRKTYQVIAGDSWYQMLNSYTKLTGKQPLPPRWALGNFSSRFGYHSQQETEATIAKFNDEKIPVDAIILDLYWFGKELQGTMGNLEFYRDSFPNPKQMIKNLRAKNVETILITEPFILTTSNRWQEAVEADILAKDSLGNPFKYDFYFGNTGLIDIYSNQGNRWFKNIYKDLANMGVTGFWGDLGEPEVHPSKLIHATGTADEVHNIYGHDWAGLVQEACQEARPSLRPFVLMRAGYSGSQRYGLIPWSGDVNRTWGGLQSQPEIALQMGMQGIGYMHSDLGGFAGDNLDDELYVRWLQYGVFQPIYRPHAQEEVPSEPVFRSDNAKALAKEAIELRYKLLPYNYTVAFENNQTGAPLMRPLFFEETNNSALFAYADAYLWGSDFLVAPILESGKKMQEVYFPKNSVWFDFYTNQRFEGGQSKKVFLNNNSIPTYVKAGAFIPMAKPMQSTKEYTGNDIELHYYFDTSVNESKGQLYNDDGLTSAAFEKGLYEILHFEGELNKQILEIELEAETGNVYQSTNKQVELILHNITQKPKYIKLNGKKLQVAHNAMSKTLSIPLVWDTKNKVEIKIKLKI